MDRILDIFLRSLPVVRPEFALGLFRDVADVSNPNAKLVDFMIEFLFFCGRPL